MTPSTQKSAGRYYTPEKIVRIILDLAGYRGEAVLCKHVMENSCGDGAFLVEIIRRYCEAGRKAGYNNRTLRGELETYIHGIELDSEEYLKACRNIANAAAEFQIDHINWDINVGNTLTERRYNHKMDFVLGNPPYVRVHHLTDYNIVKKFEFTREGMTDLFIAFYEIGLNMLKRGGILGYITPSSLYNSVAAELMRREFVKNGYLRAVLDLSHFQPFDCTSYTTIMILANAYSSEPISYYELDRERFLPVKKSELTEQDYFIDGKFFFGTPEELTRIKRIFAPRPQNPKYRVKNGFATLFDDFFIGDLPFQEYTIPIVKSSTGQFSRCFYPYTPEGKPLSFETLTQIPTVQEYYKTYEKELRARSLAKPNDWYLFGRTQGIGDLMKHKIPINQLIRRKGDLKLTPAPPGTGCYGGLYILTDEPIEKLQSLLISDEFEIYVAQLRKYKSGGYYTFSSRDLNCFLNFCCAKENGFPEEQKLIF